MKSVVALLLLLTAGVVVLPAGQGASRLTARVHAVEARTMSMKEINGVRHYRIDGGPWLPRTETEAVLLSLRQ